MMDIESIIAAAMECKDTPFKHQGRVIGRGLDCAGVLVHVLNSLELPYNDEMGYPRTPFDGQLENILDTQPSLYRVPANEKQRGDVLCMRISSAPQHIAIFLGDINGHPYIIHGSSEHGKVAVHRLDQVWGARIVRVYRIKGMA